MEFSTKMEAELKRATTFKDYVATWKKISSELKELKDLEMQARKAIIASAFPQGLQEGANKFDGDGIKLTATGKVTRSIDEDQIGLAREEYAKLNDKPVAFDDLLRVSYSLSMSEYRKVEKENGEALQIISRMITAKEGSPELKVL